jgi:hypothetical protein
MSADRHPPHLARRLLCRALPPGRIREGLIGDLEELYAARSATGRRRMAALWYWRQAVGAAARYWFTRTSRAHRTPVPTVARRRAAVAVLVTDSGRELARAVRRWRRHPVFTVAAGLTLSLGIGASAAILTVIHGVLLKPLPYPHASLRADIPVAHVDTLSDIVARSTTQLRFAVSMLALAAAITLVLSAIGTYGVMAYAVTLRRREFGIRMALGADGRRLRAMVLRQGALTAAAGLFIGLAGAATTARFLRSLLFEVEATDPSTYAAVTCGLALVALAAVYIPARRVSRLDPVEVLRAE